MLVKQGLLLCISGEDGIPKKLKNNHIICLFYMSKQVLKYYKRCVSLIK